MNGIAFANLPQLTELNFEHNRCIHKQFTIVPCSSNRFRQKISKRCASAGILKKHMSCSASPTCDAYPYSSNTLKCCELEVGTIVDSPDFTFSVHANYTVIEMLIIKDQQDVEFLPISVHESIPMLKEYQVINTPVSKITKKNFEKMYKLRRLLLERNRIEVIRSDTFEDLINLKWIGISTKALKFLGFSKKYRQQN